MLNKFKFITFIILSWLILLSCQKTEIINKVVFKNSLFNEVNLNAAEKEIVVSYESTFNDPFIDHLIETSPTKRIISWSESNLHNFGTMNKLVIDIQKASIIRKEINREIIVAGISKKRNEYYYELNFLVINSGIR